MDISSYTGCRIEAMRAIPVAGTSGRVMMPTEWTAPGDYLERWVRLTANPDAGAPSLALDPAARFNQALMVGTGRECSDVGGNRTIPCPYGSRSTSLYLFSPLTLFLPSSPGILRPPRDVRRFSSTCACWPSTPRPSTRPRGLISACS